MVVLGLSGRGPLALSCSRTVTSCSSNVKRTWMLWRRRKAVTVTVASQEDPRLLPVLSTGSSSSVVACCPARCHSWLRQVQVATARWLAWPGQSLWPFCQDLDASALEVIDTGSLSLTRMITVTVASKFRVNLKLPLWGSVTVTQAVWHCDWLTRHWPACCFKLPLQWTWRP